MRKQNPMSQRLKAKRTKDNLYNDFKVEIPCLLEQFITVNLNIQEIKLTLKRDLSLEVLAGKKIFVYGSTFHKYFLKLWKT